MIDEVTKARLAIGLPSNRFFDAGAYGVSIVCKHSLRCVAQPLQAVAVALDTPHCPTQTASDTRRSAPSRGSPSLAVSSGATTGGPALGRKFRQSACQELEPH
jgi:hypothetical protein